MKPLIYVNAMRGWREFPPDFTGFKRSAGELCLKGMFPFRTRHRREAERGRPLEPGGTQHEGCVGSCEPNCPHAGHDRHTGRRHSRMC